ncbi:MAG: GNAT family N-acetyltransferase [Steroidobacteraceae bacterium]
MTIAAFLNAPHTSHTEHLIVDELRRTGNLTISLVADAAGSVVGHVAVSPVRVSGRASGWFGLGPISVMPERQRRGVGSGLVRPLWLPARPKPDSSGCSGI